MIRHRRRIEFLEKRIDAMLTQRWRTQKAKPDFDWDGFERLSKSFDDEHPRWREGIPQATWDGLRRYLNGDESGKTIQ
jgi:hypothetical protein